MAASETPLIVPVIMCGGAGTRLWPASRESMPKQFMPLLGERSSFQETLLRVADPAVFGRPVIVTGNDFRFIVAEQLLEIGIEADIILEPAPRLRPRRWRLRPSSWRGAIRRRWRWCWRPTIW